MWGTPTFFHRGKSIEKNIAINKSYLMNQLTTKKAIYHYNFFIYVSNQKFKQSVRKSLIYQTISEQFAGANKRPKLNYPLREQAKTLFLHGKPKRNAHFWTCQFKSVHYILEVSL